MSPFKTIGNYLSLIKFSHTVFALPFAMIGYFLAVKVSGKTLDIGKLFLIILCMIFARSAAMAFNRYIDNDFDKKNPRTDKREIPVGIISMNDARIFVIISSIAFIAATYFINRICFFLSPVALLVILGYSYTKRFTALCHLILGIGLSLAPIGAFLAITGKFEWEPLFFSFIVLFWVSGFDIIYSLQDEEFDKSQNLYSIPTFVGGRNALFLSKILHLFTILFIIRAGISFPFGILYWIGALIFIFLIFFQHSIIKYNDLRNVNVAFATTNGIGSIMFAFFVILDLLFMK